MTKKEKNQIIAEIKRDPKLGLWIRPNEIYICPEEEYLEWFADSGPTRIELCDNMIRYYDVNGSLIDAEEYDNEEEAKKAYYDELAFRASNDKGEGGIWGSINFIEEVMKVLEQD